MDIFGGYLCCRLHALLILKSKRDCWSYWSNRFEFGISLLFRNLEDLYIQVRYIKLRVRDIENTAISRAWFIINTGKPLCFVSFRQRWSETATSCLSKRCMYVCIICWKIEVKWFRSYSKIDGNKKRKGERRKYRNAHEKGSKDAKCSATLGLEEFRLQATEMDWHALNSKVYLYE